MYSLLKNIIEGISIASKDYYSYYNSKINSSSNLEINNSILYLIWEIPLLTKQKENVEFQFIGVKRDVGNQFLILRNKYKSIVETIYSEATYDDSVNKFLNKLKSVIEKQ